MTEPRVIDADTALEWVREVVAEKGDDFTYEAECAYQVLPRDEDGNLQYGEALVPGCILGQAFLSHGITMNSPVSGPIEGGFGAYQEFDSKARQYEGDWTKNQTVKRIESANPGLEFEIEAVRIFSVAQAKQDRRHPYGTVREEAEKAHAELTK